MNQARNISLLAISRPAGTRVGPQLVAIGAALGLAVGGASAQPWSKGSLADNCGTPSYPCLWQDVQSEVRERSAALAIEAIERYAQGSSAREVHDWLVRQPDIIDLHTDEVSTRLRIDKGRGTWATFVPSTGTRSAPALLPPAQQQDPLQQQEDKEPPVGEDKPGQINKKSALLIGAFSWEFDEGGIFDGFLEDGSATYTKGTAEISELDLVFQFDEENSNAPTDYYDRVTAVENRIVKQNEQGTALETWEVEYNVTLDHFKNWHQYDAIHVSTHGETKCANGQCTTSIGTGEPFLKQGKPRYGKQAGVEQSFSRIPTNLANRKLTLGKDIKRTFGLSGTPDDADTPSDSGPWTAQWAGPFTYVTDRFFTAQPNYAGGLENKIIFLNACKTGTSANSETTPPMMSVLAGDNTAVIGWDDYVRVDAGSKLAIEFWKSVVTERKTVAAAFHHMFEQGLALNAGPQGPDADVWKEGDYQRPHTRGLGFTGASRVGADAVLYQTGDPDHRAVEVVTFLDPLDELPLRDGGVLTPIGYPGDGKDDRLYGLIEVASIDEDQDPSAFAIRINVDGKTLDGTWKPEEMVRDGVYHTVFEAPLGFDIEPNRGYTIDVWVELHRGGISRWVYEDVKFEYFFLDVEGPGYSDVRRFNINTREAGVTIFRGDDGFVAMHRKNDFEETVSMADFIKVSAKTNQSGSYVAGPPHRATLGMNLPTDERYPCPSSGRPNCDNALDHIRNGSIVIEEVVHKQRVGRKTRTGWVKVRFEGPVARSADHPQQWRVRGSFLIRPKIRLPYIG